MATVDAKVDFRNRRRVKDWLRASFLYLQKVGWVGSRPELLD
jgi:hypothetical protein